MQENYVPRPAGESSPGHSSRWDIRSSDRTISCELPGDDQLPDRPVHSLGELVLHRRARCRTVESRASCRPHAFACYTISLWAKLTKRPFDVTPPYLTNVHVQALF